MNLFIGNLNPETTITSLRKIFEEYGEIITAKIIYDNATGMSRGFGFIEYTDKFHAFDAIDNVDATFFEGNVISVKEAKQSNTKSGGGGGRPGGRPGGGRPRTGGPRPGGGFNSNRPAGGGSPRPGGYNSPRPGGYNSTRPNNFNSTRPEGGYNSSRPDNYNSTRPNTYNPPRPDYNKPDNFNSIRPENPNRYEENKDQ